MKKVRPYCFSLQVVVISCALWFVNQTVMAELADFADGKADAAPELERLITERGSVSLPKGTFRLSRTVEVDLTQTGWFSLTGDGTARLVMEGEGPALKITGTHEGSAAPTSFKETVWEQERSPMISGIEILGANPQADGIQAIQTMQLTLHRVVVRRCRHAIHLPVRNRNIIISDCHLYENKGVGVYLDHLNLHQINIIGSHISYNGGGGVVSQGGNVRNLHIGTCDIESNHAADGPATANILLDSTAGSISEVAITGCTIQHNSKSPDSANIRIRGAGKLSDNPKLADAPATQEGHVTITGNVFSDVQINIDIEAARGVVITGNTFWEGFQHDLLIQNSRHILISANNFDRNPRYAVNGTRNAELNGVVLRHCHDSLFTDNLIQGVLDKAAAVEIAHSSRLQISQNSILDCDGMGLLLDEVKDSVVTHNLIRDDRPSEKAKGVSLVQRGGSGNLIEGNLLGNGEQLPETAEE